MKLFTQTDLRWSNEVMTEAMDLTNITSEEATKRWGSRAKDFIWRWGCFVTAICNAKLYMGERLDPMELNNLIRKNKGYWVLKQGKDCPIGKESYVDWEVLLPIIKAKNIRFNISKDEIDISHPSKYYIAKVPFNPPKTMSGHFNLIVGTEGGITHIDSHSGDKRTDWEDSQYYQIHEIEFI